MPSETLQPDPIGRLRSADGRLRGITGMVEAGAPCADVVQQVRAVQAVLRGVNRLLGQQYLHDWLRAALSSPDAESRERALAGVPALYSVRGMLAEDAKALLSKC
ncbi:MAG: metal-sensitive transcriptional regulator [Roseiflexaceae bacterium]